MAKIFDEGTCEMAEPAELLCVGALIYDRLGRIFIVRRARHVLIFPGAWDIVGGHLHPGESVGDALAREVREETGWALRFIGEQICDWHWTVEGATRHERDFLVEVEGDLSAPCLDSREHDAWMWVTVDTVDVLTERTTGDARLTEIVARALARVKSTP